MRGINSWLVALGGCAALWSGGAVAIASECPATVESLSERLLADLPGYANRTIRREIGQRTELARHIIVAGRAEYEPLSTASQEYQPLFPEADAQVAQVFFTTLVQEYRDRTRESIQNFHWLLLAQTPERGWDLLALYTRGGTRVPDRPPSPARDTSGSALAQGIRLWLRDCNDGTLRSSIKTPEPSE